MEHTSMVAGLSVTEHAPVGANGAPLVLIHGVGGTHRHFPPELRALRGQRVLAVDLPGHGASPGPGESTVSAYAARVRAMLDALKVERAVLLGHSMGGAIALTLALESPQRVAGLVLLCTGSRLRVTQALLETTATADGLESAASVMADWSFGVMATDAMRREFTEGMRANAAEVVHGDFIACNTFDVTARLGEVRAPTLVLCGLTDQLTPAKYSELLRDKISGARLLQFPGAGHMVALEFPSEVAGAVLGFLGPG